MNEIIDICSGWIKGNSICASCPHNPKNNPVQEQAFHSLHEECRERKRFRETEKQLRRNKVKRSRY